MNPEGKQVILYAPNLNETKVKGIEDAGVKVIRKLEDLKKIVEKKD
ncbi:hypothetical protein OB236_05325 [Paenibacillus sp. WQ 127069]|uniref:Uncharacterized protein n=1 Tax=Paenibacillus baimaensis TaxID=2982185 RepID=A0ABT2UA78_9BACL|nr:hypothetical protein [Paenibacillus sp. WQ 127069]MCU6791549.1 hypothetical protein [Paenibacillus sp. WQ 127069]